MHSQERQPCSESVSTRDFCLWTKVFTHSGSERVRCPFEAKKTLSPCQFVFPKLLCVLSSSAKLCWATELRFWNYKESSSKGGMRTNSTRSGPNPSQAVRACVYREGSALCRSRRISVMLGLRCRCVLCFCHTGLGLFWWKWEQGRLCPQTFLNPPWVLFSGKSQRHFQRSPALCCVISQRHRDTESPVVRDTREAPRVWCMDEVTASTNCWTRLPEAEEQQTSHWHWPHGACFGDTFGNLHECWTG